MTTDDIMALATAYADERVLAVRGRSTEQDVVTTNAALREAIDKLVAENADLNLEIMEQCRIIGMGAERELALQARNRMKDALLRQALEALENYRRRLLVEAGCRSDNVDNIIAAIEEHLNK